MLAFFGGILSKMLRQVLAVGEEDSILNVLDTRRYGLWINLFVLWRLFGSGRGLLLL